jgi:hypothetical protein
MYHYYRTKFTPSALWCDLTPVEWSLRKMQLNLLYADRFVGSQSRVGTEGRSLGHPIVGR